MLESSFQVGRVAGIRIGIHYTWLIIFFLLNTSLYYIFRQQLEYASDTTALITALITSTAFFISLTLHELGHSIVAIRNGISVKAITLFIFGGVAQSEKEADRPMVEFKIAIAGPLVSIALAGLFWLLRDLLAREDTPLFVALDWLATINFIIAVFNMIPGFPLDGGRVFRALIWGFTGDEAKGMRIAVAGGRLVAFSLMGIGMLISFQTGSILSGIWMIGIGWFLLSAAEASGRAFSQHRIFSHISVQSMMNTSVPRVRSDRTVEDWVSGSVLPQLHRSALVEDHGAVVGIVSLSDTAKLPEKEWGAHPVSDIMTPLARIKLHTRDSSIEDVLRTMQDNKVNQVPIVEGDKVVGWIDRESLVHAITVYSEAGRY